MKLKILEDFKGTEITLIDIIKMQINSHILLAIQILYNRTN
jgi:hypothetical protein